MWYRKGAILAIIFLACTVCLEGIAMAQLGGARHDASTLEGSWVASVVVTHATEAAEGLRATPEAPVTMLQTFTREGSLVETRGGPPIPIGPPGSATAAATLSVGHGTWVRSATATETFFYGAQHVVFDSSGNPAGVAHIVASASLSGDRQGYSGEFSIEFFDLEGQSVRSGEGTVTADRIVLGSPPAGSLNGR